MKVHHIIKKKTEFNVKKKEQNSISENILTNRTNQHNKI